MKHQKICEEIGISYQHYTTLRDRYRFFCYITDLLTMDYVLSLDDTLVTDLLTDLKEILQHKAMLHGLDLALFGGLSCFGLDNLLLIRNVVETVNRYQSHKWQYPNIGDTDVISL